MSKQTYRLLDVFIFTLIASVIEIINVVAFNYFKVDIGKYSLQQVYTLSFAVVLGIIAVFRWNYYGLIVAPVAGLVSVLVRNFIGQNVTTGLYLAQSIGNMAIAVGLLFFIKNDKKKMKQSYPMMFAYYFLSYIAVEILRSICQIGTVEFNLILLNNFAFDLINIVFGAAIFFIALKQKDLVTDMNTYLLEMNELSSKLTGQMIVSKNDEICVDEIANRNDIVNEAALLDGGVLSNEDLRNLEEYRKHSENRDSIFDKENRELKKYRLDKEAKKHGSK